MQQKRNHSVVRKRLVKHLISPINSDLGLELYLEVVATVLCADLEDSLNVTLLAVCNILNLLGNALVCQMKVPRPKPKLKYCDDDDKSSSASGPKLFCQCAHTLLIDQFASASYLGTSFATHRIVAPAVEICDSRYGWHSGNSGKYLLLHQWQSEGSVS